MATTFTNTSGEGRWVPEGTPQNVPAGTTFTVPDERDSAFDEQPYFTPA